MSNLDHSVTVNVFAHAKHTYDFDTHHVRWGEWVEYLTRGHEVREDKDGPMFNGAVFDNIEQTQTIHRSEQNVVGYSMLILDYDGPLKIKHAKQLFADTEYVGYTSYRHNHPDKGNVDCFRIVVPLAFRVEKEQITNRRNKVLIDWAGGTYHDDGTNTDIPLVDKSSFSHSRSFYSPSVSAKQAKYAESWYNPGELLDITTLAVDPIVRPEITTRVETPHSDESKQRIIESLRKVNQTDYQQWLVIMMSMCSNDFTYQQFLDATNEPNSSSTARLWKSTQAKVNQGITRGIGVLVNHCKNHGTWMTERQYRLEQIEQKLSFIKG